MSADFDKAIDGAVREMLDVEPRADLLARVTAQLAASGSRRSASGFRLPASAWVVGPVAAAAIVVLAVFIARRSEPVVPRPTVVARGADTRLPGTPATLDLQPAVQPQVPAEPRHVARASEPLIAAASLDANGTAMPPLKSIAPIAMTPIAEDSMAPAAIAVPPLEPIVDVQIAPLTPPDRRN